MKKIIGLFALSTALCTVSCKDNAAAKFDDNAATTTATEAQKLETTEEYNAGSDVNNAVAGQAKMAFDKEVIEFGDIKIGDIAKGEFEIKNTGDVDLVIMSATGSCGCTVPKKPEQPIKPGESAKMEVSFDSTGKPGMQEKTVTVTANTAEGTHQLKIKANVKS